MLNKKDVLVILAVILCYKKGIACLEFKKSSRSTESCEISGCEITCSEINWTWISLISAYNNHTMCHSNGINLTLPSHRNVPGTNFNWDWFPSNGFNIKIIGLQIDLRYTNNIGNLGDHPFTLTVFNSVKYLRLNNLHINVLPKWTFQGLSSLEELVINNATLYSYADGMLEFANNSLKSFSLIEQNEANNISISSFIGRGSVNLTKIEYVKIQYKLSIIDDTSLRGIPFVKVLDLSECYIISIEEHSFDTFESNLEVINLERNKLITLPTGLFSKLQLNSVLHTRKENLKIRLLQNPWHCDSELVYVKALLINYTNFDEGVLCASPGKKNGTQIKDAELDDVTTISTSTTLETTSTTSEGTSPSEEVTTETTNTLLETTTTVFSNDKECHGSHDKITISSQTHKIQLNFQFGKIVVQSEVNRTEKLLIWFGSELVSNDLRMYQKGQMVDCVTNFSYATVDNLTIGSTYTFCLMNASERSISPLNCISYNHQAFQSDNLIWMYASRKSLCIGVLFTTLIAAVVAGCVIGGFSTRRLLSHDNNISFAFESFVASKMAGIDDIVRQKSDSLSALQSTINFQHGEGLCMTDFENKLDSPPPLPPHPRWTSIRKKDEEFDKNNYNDECENYYSVVK